MSIGVGIPGDGGGYLVVGVGILGARGKVYLPPLDNYHSPGVTQSDFNQNRSGWQAGGTHPTRMLSFLDLFLQERIGRRGSHRISKH